jgi:hypothetical protein
MPVLKERWNHSLVCLVCCCPHPERVGLMMIVIRVVSVEEEW